MPTPKFRVNEIYRTIQGEGWHTGLPCTLVRLQGCNLRCPFCDTQYAQDVDGGEEFTLSEIVSAVKKVHRMDDIILLTGGEPCLQNVVKLADEIGWMGHVHLETNGTIPITFDQARIFDWITCSPKATKPDANTMRHVDEVKWLVANEDNILELEMWVSKEWIHHNSKISLQPLSQDPQATTIAFNACLAHGWRLSIQTHKLIGVR